MIKAALIPAAGRGLRLDRPGTPKPLVDVDGQPMIFRLIRQLKKAGVERVIVIVGFEGPRVVRELQRHPELCEGVQFAVSKEWEKGLASTLLSAEGMITEPFVLAMSDHVFDNVVIDEAVNLPAFDEEGVAIITERIDSVYDAESAVRVSCDGGRVGRIGLHLEKYSAIDMGLFVFSPQIFTSLRHSVEQQGQSELSAALDEVARRGKLGCLMSSGYYDDVDTPSALVHAEMRLRKDRRESALAEKGTGTIRREFYNVPYVIDHPQTTRIVVGRGFIRNPAEIELIRPESASSPIFVFTDETVAELYGYAFKRALLELGYSVHLIVLPVGEESKSLTNYAFLVERVLRKGVDEQSVFISLGGGVVCNVCGFVASTIYRGLNLIHLPTTLMAQCDAAVSHKQGINGYQGKNMLGTYYSPQLVAIDVETLTTLPERLVADGIAEVIKHAIGQDQAYVDYLLGHNGDLRDLNFIEEIIKWNVKLKCELVSTDPKEHREGMILQYGHTVGHPVEHLSGYSLYHGESVAVGMSVAARVSRIMGGCGPELVQLQDELNRRFKLPCRIPTSVRPVDIIESMRYNKRFLTEGTRMALLSEVGKLWSVNGDFAIPVSEKTLLEAVRQCCEEAVS